MINSEPTFDPNRMRWTNESLADFGVAQGAMGQATLSPNLQSNPWEPAVAVSGINSTIGTDATAEKSQVHASKWFWIFALLVVVAFSGLGIFHFRK